MHHGHLRIKPAAWRRALRPPSPSEAVAAEAWGLAVGVGRFTGLLLLDHCPMTPDVRFGESPPEPQSHHAQQMLSPSVSLRRLDPLEPGSWESAVCAAVGLDRLPDQLPLRNRFRAAHPCAVLQVDLPPVASLLQARRLMEHAGPCWLLALSLRVGAECEPFAQVLIDRRGGKADVEIFSGFPHGYIVRMNTAADFARRIVPSLASDRRLRLLVGLYRDFQREFEDSPAVLKGWSLLEVMAADEPGEHKKDKVRALLERMETAPEGVFLNALYAEGEDLLDIAYRHRNCVAHEGWCHEANSRCSAKRWQSACQHARLIRMDLQLLLQGLLSDFIGTTTSWVVGPGGSALVPKPGFYRSIGKQASGSLDASNGSSNESSCVV